MLRQVSSKNRRRSFQAGCNVCGSVPEVLTNSQISSMVMAAGTSMATCLPHFMAWTPIRAWFFQSVAINEVDIGQCDDLLPNLGIAGELTGCRKAPGFQNPVAFGGVLRQDVAQSHDFDTFDVGHPLDGPGPRIPVL